jgi:ATP/maltotriose-dependent transcriptional regulator MalT
MAVEVGAARRRIIRRPRLTAMLDGSSSQIRMLIAPAGYGKTTLAREWLGEAERQDVWYRGGPATADVAALAAGVAEAVSGVVPDAGKRMRERIRATGHPEEDVDILAELFAEDVQEWPQDAWLAIDDYQFAMESAASERFVDLLTQLTPIQMLVTSRRRPSWATARRILYDEIFEIDRRALAMEDGEARAVIDRREDEIGPLLARARGWPAVIGLYGMKISRRPSNDALPDELYDYFAQELFAELAPQDQIGLARLSFVGSFDYALAATILETRAHHTVDEGLRTGVLTEPARGMFEIHPLLASALRDHSFRDGATERLEARHVGESLLDLNLWDGAVELGIGFREPDLVTAALERALEQLVDLGRVATIVRWLDAAASLRCQGPVLDLAEAEVAFRVGHHRKAEELAVQAARQLSYGHPLTSRAHLRAGHGALLSSREVISVDHFDRAFESATSAAARREALFGLYSALSELDFPRATKVQRQLVAHEPETVEDRLRQVAITLIAAARSGAISEAIVSVEPDLRLIESVSNPLISTAVLHAFTNNLTLNASYARSLDVAEDLNEQLRRNRLDFGRPYALIDLAAARLGLRHFAQALQDLHRAYEACPFGGDLHVECNVSALRCRVLLASGRLDDAVLACDPEKLAERPAAPLYAEMLVSRAVALASGGHSESALTLAEEAREVSPSALMVQVLGPAIYAICNTNGRQKQESANAAWETAIRLGNFDSIVVAYRAHPPLLAEFETVGGGALLRLLKSANDLQLAKKYGIAGAKGARRGGGMTPRECEVLDLVAAGASNREAAQALFISESTVKAHLRHAYEKLGARSRADAVTLWLTRQ